MIIKISNELLIQNINKTTKNKIKQLQTFYNPEYIKAVKYNLSLFGINKQIRLYTEINEDLILPRGSLSKIKKKFKPDIEQIVDNTTEFEKIVFKFRGELRDLQKPWVEEALKYNYGTCVAPAGSGKTVMALKMAALLGQPFLWLTNRETLLNQFLLRVEEFLEDVGEIGIFESTKLTKGKICTVGMIPTLMRRDLLEYANSFGTVFIDEAHRVPSNSFTTVIKQLNPKNLYGLTATPFREDELEFLMEEYIGPIRVHMNKQEIANKKDIIIPKVIVRQLGMHYKIHPKMSYQRIVSQIQKNEIRNNKIILDVIKEIAQGNICVVLTTTIKHGKILAEKLEKHGINYSHVCCKDKNIERTSKLENFLDGNVGVIIATYSLLAEGFDHRPTNRLFLATPIKSKTLIIQAVGRISRKYKKKENAIVYDYLDNINMFIRQFNIRKNIYDLEGMEVIFN